MGFHTFSHGFACFRMFGLIFPSLLVLRKAKMDQEELDFERKKRKELVKQA